MLRCTNEMTALPRLFPLTLPPVFTGVLTPQGGLKKFSGVRIPGSDFQNPEFLSRLAGRTFLSSLAFLPALQKMTPRRSSRLQEVGPASEVGEPRLEPSGMHALAAAALRADQEVNQAAPVAAEESPVELGAPPVVQGASEQPADEGDEVPLPVDEEGGVSSSRQQPPDLRQVAADSIVPGCTQWVIATWQPVQQKPQAKHLKLSLAKRQLREGECDPTDLL